MISPITACLSSCVWGSGGTVRGGGQCRFFSLMADDNSHFFEFSVSSGFCNTGFGADLHSTRIPLPAPALIATNLVK